MPITNTQAPVFYSEKAYAEMNRYISKENPSSVFVLVDNNTREHCLSRFLQQLATKTTIEVIEIDAGEEYKNIETCMGVWNALSELGADRKSLMLNLGGGVVTDLGGFVASTYKRGISYINIPTTLLAMVDASVGGKTGVDLGNLKNQVGVITQPQMVMIDTTYLESLPASEMRSGLAEILKHGLIASEAYWSRATNLHKLGPEDLKELIIESVNIKSAIVTKDPHEENLRKTLNFGHTLGHAIESYFLSHPEKTKLLHGEAIAIGMILESYISTKKTGFSEENLKQVTESILDVFKKEAIQKEDFDPIIQLLKFDKKNAYGRINFVLLKDYGVPQIDCSVSNEILEEALNFYLEL